MTEIRTWLNQTNYRKCIGKVVAGTYCNSEGEFALVFTDGNALCIRARSDDDECDYAILLVGGSDNLHGKQITSILIDTTMVVLSTIAPNGISPGTINHLPFYSTDHLAICATNGSYDSNANLKLVVGDEVLDADNPDMDDFWSYSSPSEE